MQHILYAKEYYTCLTINTRVVVAGYEVSLGIGHAGSTHKLLSSILKYVNANQVVVHFHDTYGRAMEYVCWTSAVQ